MFYGASTPYFPSPELLNQYCNFHLGVVKNVGDPSGRGRVMVEIPGLLGEGQKNWAEWVEIGGTPVGSSKTNKGDIGIWWPVEPGAAVLVGFIAGDPFALWALPGPPCQEDYGNNKQMIPAEAKKSAEGSPRKGTRCKMVKSEAGHTLIMDDNGKSELLALLSWSGSGLAISASGKEEDEEEKETEESKPRKGKFRGTKNIYSDTAPKPKEILEGGLEYMSLLDLLKQGIITVADDNYGGRVCICSRKKDGSLGPSIVLDAYRDCIFIQAGETQLQIFGESPGPVKERIFVTKEMILQSKFLEVKDYFSNILDKLKERFKKYDSEGGDSGGQGQGQGQGQNSSPTNQGGTSISSGSANTANMPNIDRG